jgi:hypothetical protein
MCLLVFGFLPVPAACADERIQARASALPHEDVICSSVGLHKKKLLELMQDGSVQPRPHQPKA